MRQICDALFLVQLERTEASVELLTNPQLKERAQQVLPSEGLEQLQRVDAMLGEGRFMSGICGVSACSASQIGSIVWLVCLDVTDSSFDRSRSFR